MPETTIQEQIVREAPEIEAIKLGLLQSARTLADRPVTLPEQQIAGFSGLQQQAFDAAIGPQGVGSYLPGLLRGQEAQAAGLGTLGTGLGTLGTGLGTMGTGLGTLGTGLDTMGTGLATTTGALEAVEQARAAAAGTAGLFQPTDLSPYTNPFQQQVIDTTLQRLDEEGARAQNQLAAQAGGAGAFGGSRFGIESAQLGENLQDARARALAQLNQQNFAQALQTGQTAFENQQRRQAQQSQLFSGLGALTGQLGAQQAQIGGQQAGVGGQQAGIGAQQAGIGGQQAGIGAQQAQIGGQQIGAGQALQQAGIRDLATLQQLGGQQQQQQRSLLEAARANAQKQLYEPYSRVSFLSDIYKGAPSTQTSLGALTTPTPPAPSAFQQIAGAGTGLLGLGVANKQLGGLF
tara:strand:- start:159 stop:1373 length:1215 start_codon:yes stop_codon:yes gene_type:complete